MQSEQSLIAFLLVSWRSVGIDTIITEPELDLVSGPHITYLFER